MDELLFLAHRIPYPPNKGDKIRSFHILKHLSASYRVHLGAFVDHADDWQYREKVTAMCASACLLPLRPLQARLRSLTGLPCGTALSLPYYRDRRMQEWVNSRLARDGLRVVFVFSSPMAQYVPVPGTAAVQRIVDFVDVDSEKWRQYAARKSWPASWVYRREGERLLAYERQLANGFDAGVFVTADEAALFKRLAPGATGHICSINNGVDHEYFTPDGDYENPYPDASSVLVFTGAMDYWANIDAVDWFARAIFPRIRDAVGRAQFAIIGASPSASVRRLASLPGVLVMGAVADIRPYLAHAHAAVAPLRIARGVQNKVLEALAMATPVLATPAAMEGIAFHDPAVIQVADSERELAECGIALLQRTDAPAARAARQWVREHYDWQTSLRQFDQLLTAPANGQRPDRVGLPDAQIGSDT